jgi:uncharacterized membrane protein YqjE
MENEKNSFVATILHLLQGSRSLASDVSELAWLEAQLAKKNLIRIAVLVGLFALLFTVAWLGFAALITVYLTSLNFTWLESIAIVVGMHGVLLLVISFLITRARSNLTFKATRRQLQHLRRKDKAHV